MAASGVFGFSELSPTARVQLWRLQSCKCQAAGRPVTLLTPRPQAAAMQRCCMVVGGCEPIIPNMPPDQAACSEVTFQTWDVQDFWPLKVDQSCCGEDMANDKMVNSWNLLSSLFISSPCLLIHLNLPPPTQKHPKCQVQTQQVQLERWIEFWMNHAALCLHSRHAVFEIHRFFLDYYICTLNTSLCSYCEH